MTRMAVVPHALQRLSQRAISMTDLELVHQIGREVNDGYLVLKKDAEALALSLERLAERARRLGDMRLVYSDGCLVTAYRARQSKRKRLLRSAERRNLED